MEGSTCRKLSDYVRRSIFDKPIVTTHRNQSIDALITEAVKLRNELNSLGNNLNQAVKMLYTLHQIPEFKNWIIAFDLDKKIIFNKVEEIKNSIQKIAEKWLQ